MSFLLSHYSSSTKYSRSDKSAFRFLQAYKVTAKPLRRTGLVSEMTKNPDLARFVSQLLPNAIKNGGAGMHRALLVFHAGVLLDFIATSKELNEGTTALLLAASLDVLQAEPGEVQKANTSLLQEAVVRTHLSSIRSCVLIQFSAACQPARSGRPVAEM